MNISNDKLQVTSVRDVFIPIDRIFRVVYDSRANETYVLTAKGATVVLDSFDELREALPHLCEVR